MSEIAERPALVTHARFVTITLAAAITGLTRKAIESKIARRVWLENKHYRKVDGNIWIDTREIEKWVEKGTA